MASFDDPADRSWGKKIFLNNLDSYQGRNIGRFLSKCVARASQESADDDEDTKSTTSIVDVDQGKEGSYTIVGTMKDKEKPKPDFAKEIVQFENRDQLYEYLVECEIIIYDISEDPDQIDEAMWTVSEMHSDLEKIEKLKTFILVSTCMTWAKSKSLDLEDPDVPFTEEDYRKRKPHPSYKEHISAEKTVIKLGKTNKAKLATYVICSGLTYGAEENVFHYLFKSAWHNAPELQCFGDGKNIIPTIHVKDLAAVIQNVIEIKPKVRYIIAKDEAQNTLEDIVKAISQNLGSTKIKYISKEDALLDKDIQQADFDMLLINLKMDAVCVKERMHINWVCETGLVENVVHLIKEYKVSRSLQPLRAVILGPPAVGKTTVSKQLCDHYKLHHITIKQVIDEAIENLKIKSRTKVEEEAGEEEETEAGQQQRSQELLDQIQESRENNNGRIEDQLVIQFLREKLKSMPCQNQGFILDGYPKTTAQARELFAVSAETEPDDDEEETASDFDPLIMPEFVVSLEAPDEFLKNRVINLPESVVAASHNTEKGLQRRLAEFRILNTDDETVLAYFDEHEFLPEKIDVTKDESEMMKDTVEKIKKIFGGLRNYGPTPEELEAIGKIEEEIRLQKEAEERAFKEQQDAEELHERKRRQEEWSQRLSEVKREEFELLEAQSIPLRNYLMKHVMPTLTQALIDCCKIRPDDPIDYLAEYLFQHNPQID